MRHRGGTPAFSHCLEMESSRGSGRDGNDLFSGFCFILLFFFCTLGAHAAWNIWRWLPSVIRFLCAILSRDALQTRLKVEICMTRLWSYPVVLPTIRDHVGCFLLCCVLGDPCSRMSRTRCVANEGNISLD